MMTHRQILAVGALILAVTAASPVFGGVKGALDRAIRLSVEVTAPVEEVWRAWTTDAGVQTFFAPGSHVEARVDGAYDIYFFPENPPGQRGAEGMRVLIVDAPRYLAFTWNAPPSIPTVRGQRTMVTVYLQPIGKERTRVHLRHMGWGVGDDWDQAYDYFTRAWGDVVLKRLVYSFEHGPVDWSSPPALDETD